jgi:uncharacterized protein
MHNITPLDCSRIAQDLQVRKLQVESVVHLLDEGNTVPFITRYRKERTGGLNEEAIRQIQARVNFLRALAERKQTILKSIDTQGRLTPELREAIEKADTTKRLEDLYLPYKPKKRSLAATARERGLEPLALAVWHSDAAAAGNLGELFAGLVNPERQLNTPDEVRQGVQHILAELIAETADVRAAVRRVLWETGKVVAGKNEKLADGQGLEYKDYFEFTEPARQIPPHRILALNRGEKEGAIRVKMEWHADQVHQAALHLLADHLRAVAGKMPPPAPIPAPTPAAEPVPRVPGPTEQAPTEPSAPAESPPTPDLANAAPASAVLASAAPADVPPAAPPEPTPPSPPAEQAAPLVASLTPTEPVPASAAGDALSAHSEFRSAHAAFLHVALEDALARLLMPSLEREVRNELTDEAEAHAVNVFARNLRSLLLQPPLRGRRVLAVDPGFRTGCKLAALDEYGNLLEHSVIYPFGGGPREKKGPRERKPAPQAPATAGAPESAQVGPAEQPPTAHVEQPPAPPALPTEGHTAETPPPEPAPVPAAAEIPSPTPEPMPAKEATAPPATPMAVEPAAAAEAPAATEAPAPPAPDRRAEAKNKLHDLVMRHQLSVIALGNGTGCRETEELVADLIGTSLPELSYVVVNEAGASVYSVSQVGREEFPTYDATTRSAISIGRRLQDPLSELVKIDPQSIGVGLYQHDMGRKELKESLEGVIESAVNLVGVDLNTASVPLLRYVSGLNQLVARELVDFRKQHGPFGSRAKLTDVPNLGPARFTQAAGFLKVPDAANPLDCTWIHPESYALAERILSDFGYGVDVLGDRGRQDELHAKLSGAQPDELAHKLGAGVPTVADILQALLKPGRDPREDLPPPIFKKGILRLEDLQPGMELKGTVLNVVDFGAFVDIGLKDSGLVHISQMANRYIKSPYEIVSVNDVVTVWVMNVDQDRHRVSLSMIKPGTERRTPERRPQGPRPPQEKRPPQAGPRPPQHGPRPPQHGKGPRRGPHPQGQPASGPPGEGRGPRPPRGRGPHRGPQPPREGAAASTDAATPAPEGARPAEPPRHALPPRKPRREPPKPKLTKEAIEGKVPLRTFGELSALFATKREEERPKPPAPPAEPTEKPAATMDMAPAEPPAPPAAPPTEPTAQPQPEPPPPPEGSAGPVG